jgi:hypothetical protein
MGPEVIRRQPGNSIDYDFYRRRAARARTEAMREFARPLRIVLLAAGAVAALLIVVNAPAQPAHCPHGRGDMTTSAYWCPVSDVRITLQHAFLRTSETRGH